MSHIEFEELWQNYETSLRKFIQSKVSNEMDVDDLRQEIMFKTYKNIEDLQSIKNVKSWLFKIARNTIIDFYRKSANKDFVDFDEESFEQEEQCLIEKELSQCTKIFVNSLSEESASLLKAIDLEGQSQKVYASSHDLSYSTLKSRVQKARGELRERFEDCCSFSLSQSGKILDYTKKEH